MMPNLDIIHAIFPFLGLVLLIAGLKTSHKNLIVISLWLSLIAILIHYRLSGGEILGSYFGYLHTLVYSINLLVLLIAIIYLLVHFAKEAGSGFIRYTTGLIAAISITSIVILLGNLWTNAYFIEHRYPGTPVLQVATFTQLDYCSYSHVFYKVDSYGKIGYLCPNHYGLLPSIGYLDTAPGYVIKQLPAVLQTKFQKGS
ncbi:type I secretion system protein LssZ [Legionella dresdenensis]|uniref:Type I secretion system protein LssZ n=1 Tax=Legionella dresdenensis TaxID=450200 RepID=A0ABV8CBF0_9GAMM